MFLKPLVQFNFMETVSKQECHWGHFSAFNIVINMFLLGMDRWYVSGSKGENLHHDH